MVIERLPPARAGDYRTLMLEAYAAHPEAFTSRAAERAGLPLAWWEALSYAHDRTGVMVVQLTVTGGNGPAEALYESCGFVRFGVEPLAVAVGSRYLSKVHLWRRVQE